MFLNYFVISSLVQAAYVHISLSLLTSAWWFLVIGQQHRVVLYGL